MVKNTVIVILFVAVIALAAAFYVNVNAPLSPPGEASPQIPFSYAPTTWKSWNDTIYRKETGTYVTYSLSYPRDFDIRTGDQVAGGTLSDSYVQIRFPNDAFATPPSNFAEGFLVVGRSAGKSAVASCFVNPNPGPGAPRQLSAGPVIDGRLFRYGTTTDVGAGNIYNIRLYRTVFDGDCWGVDLVVHTGNIGNYTPGTVAEFDQSKAFFVLEKILGTFALSTSTSAIP